MARPRAPLAALALLLAFAAPQESRAVAPNIDWRTVLTPHFRVHFHRGEAALADRVAHLAEEALALLSKRLGHEPEDPIHIVLTDETDSANGLADVLPYNRVLLYAAVPDVGSSLGDFDEYRRLLVTHELAHVVHLDDISGLPRLANRIIGKQLSPNLVAPRWLIEGLAVWMETALTSKGRARSSLSDSLIRAQIYDGNLPAIDEFTTSRRLYPGGSSPYLYGGRFIQFIADRHGSDAIGEITHRYGGRVVPYGLNIVARESTGEDFVTLYDAWVEHEKALATEVLERVPEPTAFSLIPGLPAIVRGLRFAKDGSAALVHSPRDDDDSIVFYGPSEEGLGPERLRVRTNEGLGAFSADGQRFVATISDTYAHRFRFRDLEIIDVRTGDRLRRTHGARLSDPDVGLLAGAETIVAVGQAAGHTRIMRMSLDGQDEPAVLVDRGPSATLFSPRISPDGSLLIYGSADADGTRRLWLRALATGEEHTIYESQGLAHGPRFSADGRALLFTDDRDGIFDIYAIDLATGALGRRTQVRTAAFEPIEDPSGARLFATLGTSSGFTLGEVRRTRSATAAPPLPALRPTLTASSSLSVYAEEPYNAWETLLPKAYTGSFSLTRSAAELTLSIKGSDAIERHAYRLDVFYSGEAERLGFDLSYTNHQLWMPISLAAHLDATPFLSTYRPYGRSGDVLTSRWIMRAGVDIPLGDWQVGHGFSFSYTLEVRTAVDGPPKDPFQGAPSYNPELRLSGVGLSYRLSTVRGFEDSISSARGISFDIGANGQHPALGSDLRVLSLTAHFSAFLPMFYGFNHVLALRLSGGTSVGAPEDRPAFSLGGLPVRNLFADLINETSFGADVIRGYAPGARRGASYYLGTAELRMPIFRLERGLDTVPIYFERLTAAAFADAGDAPRSTPRLADVAVGVGGELRVELTILYYVPITLRGGYARGLTRDGIDDAYLVLGGSF
ncbi:MAG: hypothetical protein U1E65_14235 [Myxococcota bacterium]